MQSGLKKTKLWIIEFEFDPSLQKDVLMDGIVPKTQLNS